VAADDAYLKRSISDPDAQIVDGFPAGVMPGGVGGAKLTDAEIADIVAYLQTL
jgi:cytochrome c oxidase subunit 2